MAAIGRTRFTGNDRRNLFRALDRATRIVRPKPVNDTSLLPPARDNMGRIMFVAGSVKAFYYSDGATWTAL